MAGRGHNSIARDQLRNLVERVERLEEEKRMLSDDIKEVYAEAKARGFDTRILRKVVKLRKMEASDREEEQSMVDLYMSALGMLTAAIREASQSNETEEPNET